MVAHTDVQKQKFQERVERIQAAHCGSPAATVVTPARASRKGSDLVAEEPRRRLPRAGLLTFGLGLAVMLAANVAVFRAAQVQGNFFADLLASVGPFPIAAGILFVLMVGFGLRDKPHVIGFALGLPLMYFAEPYLATLAPDSWVQMYSAEHVDSMLIRAGLREPIIVTE